MRFLIYYVCFAIFATLSPPLPAQELVESAATSDVFRIELTFRSTDKVTFGGPDCPVCVIGDKVWHFQRNEVVQTLEANFDSRCPRNLSDNGQWIAGSDKLPGEAGVFQVWNCVTGELHREISLDPDFNILCIQFLLNKYVAVKDKNSESIRIWDLATGNLLKTIEAISKYRQTNPFAFTSDAKFYALVGERQVFTFETKSGKEVGVMSHAKNLYGSGQGTVVEIRNNRIASVTASTAPHASLFMSRIKSLAFSPDDKELAAVSTLREGSLVVWDQDGRVVFDEPLWGRQNLPRKFKVQWLRDRSGWWVDGDFVDRETKKTLFTIDFQGFVRKTVYPLGRTHVLALLPVNHREYSIKTIALPWEQALAESATLPIVLK